MAPGFSSRYLVFDTINSCDVQFSSAFPSPSWSSCSSSSQIMMREETRAVPLSGASMGQLAMATAMAFHGASLQLYAI